MESDESSDNRPLIHHDSEESREEFFGLCMQSIFDDPEYDQVIYGYRKSRWRTVMVRMMSVLTLGIPYLVFHWYPTWFLYMTSVRCPFPLADQVLVVETYQKKCKSFYIHMILNKDIGDTSGLINEGFVDDLDAGEQSDCIKKPEDQYTPIHLDDGSTLMVDRFKYFKHKKQVFVWESARAQWCRLAGVEVGATCAHLHNMAVRPPSTERRIRMLNIYGLNEIKVKVHSVLTLVLLEVSNPFYVFQLFTVGVWIAEKYYYYCGAVVIMSLFGIITSVVQTKRNQRNLRATVEASDVVQLASGREVDSRAIAPGDVVVLGARGCTLQFDAALLTGAAVVNESMLTGESVPVTKTALLRTDKVLDMKEHSSSMLFCGTKVIQTKSYNNEPVRALVLRTGYATAKGELVRSILYPVPADFKFDRDSYKFIFILAIIASIGFAYTIALKAARAIDAGDIILKALDILTIVIPPALPAAMTVGRLYAVSRLQKARIACLNTRAVNVSGSLDCLCFDKTGTLTEDGLDMWGVVPVSGATDPCRLGRPNRTPHTMSDLQPLKLGMATCHSITLLDGELSGDPLDLKMFESTGWSLEEPDMPKQANCDIVMHTIVRPKKDTIIEVDGVNMPLELGVVQQYQFLSSLQRSSVVCRALGEDVLRVYCKGAPETLRTLCRPHTVPENLNEVLNSYAEKGYRVIAMSTRVLETTPQELQRMYREEVECDLEFLGLVIMENRLKAATTGVIRELKEANIHVVMITGDNILTAVSVAKECGILASTERVVTLQTEGNGKSATIYCQSTINGSPVGGRKPLPRTFPADNSGRGSYRSAPPSASSSDSTVEMASDPRYKIIMTGDTWKVLREQYPEVVGPVVSRGAVFARVTADQKQQLVIEYQALGYYVGMCGDGANDCGALRTAHTGISLSELESSVAAPFTSQHPDILCVSKVLREGRAALTTSFGVFKFMVAYSLTEFLSVSYLYYFDSNLTDFQFLYIDLALIVNFAFFFGMTEAYTGKLCKIPPLTSLLGLVPLFSLIGQLFFNAVAQFLSFYALTKFPWYVRHVSQESEDNQCWENYSIFAVSMFQYIILALVFSHGSPYRRSVITNKQLMISMVIMTGISAYIAVKPADWLKQFMQLEMPKDVLLTYIIFALAAFNLLIALFFERVIIQFLMSTKQWIPKFLKEKRVRKTPYMMIKRHLTERDYLDYDSVVLYESETSGVVSQSTSYRGS